MQQSGRSGTQHQRAGGREQADRSFTKHDHAAPLSNVAETDDSEMQDVEAEAAPDEVQLLADLVAQSNEVGSSMKTTALRSSKLLQATGRLPFFSDMHLEVGAAGWQRVHLALCAKLCVRRTKKGGLLFEGLRSLANPIILLEGSATLLGVGPPPHGGSCEVCDLREGACLSKAALTWLDPGILAAVAREPVRYLELPSDVYDRELKLIHLRLLSRRAAAIEALPLFNDTGDDAARVLAFASCSQEYAPHAQILREGDPCDGLHVLLNGRVQVSVQCQPDTARAGGMRKSKSDAMVGLDVRGDDERRAESTGTACTAGRRSSASAEADAEARNATHLRAASRAAFADQLAGQLILARVDAPEVLGVIDVFEHVLRQGQEAARRASGTTQMTANISNLPYARVGPAGKASPFAPSSADATASFSALCLSLNARQSYTAPAPAPAPVVEVPAALPAAETSGATHGASVWSLTDIRSFFIPTPALLRHLPIVVLQRLTISASDRGMVRNALKEESIAQYQRKEQELQLQAAASRQIAASVALEQGTQLPIIPQAFRPQISSRSTPALRQSSRKTSHVDERMIQHRRERAARTLPSSPVPATPVPRNLQTPALRPGATGARLLANQASSRERVNHAQAECRADSAPRHFVRTPTLLKPRPAAVM